MLRYILHRIPSVLLVLFFSSMLIFAIIRLIPGDPAATLAGPDAAPSVLRAIRHELGLDLSMPEQYLRWLEGVITFDLGRSYLVGGDIATLVAENFLNTVVLTSAALLIALVLGSVLGTLWASSRSQVLDAVLTGSNAVAVALPPFVTGILLILLFGIVIPVLPVGGVPPDGFLTRLDFTVQYLVMPAVCLALPVTAVLSRYLCETLRTELRLPYITMATALGVPRRRIIWRHALRNALPTSVTVFGIQVGNLLSGAVLVEAIFSWPGLGQLIGQAINRRDYPVVQILLLLSVTVFVLIQLLTDVIQTYLDPRLRLGKAS